MPLALLLASLLAASAVEAKTPRAICVNACTAITEVCVQANRKNQLNQLVPAAKVERRTPKFRRQCRNGYVNRCRKQGPAVCAVATTTTTTTTVAILPGVTTTTDPVAAANQRLEAVRGTWRFVGQPPLHPHAPRDTYRFDQPAQGGMLKGLDLEGVYGGDTTTRTATLRLATPPTAYEFEILDVDWVVSCTIHRFNLSTPTGAIGTVAGRNPDCVTPTGGADDLPRPASGTLVR